MTYDLAWCLLGSYESAAVVVLSVRVFNDDFRTEPI